MSKKVVIGEDVIYVGKHEFRVVDVSSRLFGAMFLVLRDGVYFAHRSTMRQAITLIGHNMLS